MEQIVQLSTHPQRQNLWWCSRRADHRRDAGVGCVSCWGVCDAHRGMVLPVGIGVAHRCGRVAWRHARVSVRTSAP